MKIAVIGSGAIGCLYGAYLSKFNEVHMICRRQKIADSINRDGLTVFEPDGTKQRYPDVCACLSGECDGEMDLVIIIVKGMDTSSAIEANESIIGKHTLVMTLQNGGGNDLVISRYVPMERIIIGTTKHNSVNLDNGKVSHSGAGTTLIGCNTNDTDISSVARALEEAGFETEISDNIQRIIWNKLFVNLSINTFTAITKTQIGTMIDNEYAWFFAEKMICEAIDVAEAEGQHFSYLEVLDSVHKVCETISTGYSSMSQDVMNCRKTEIDVINGFVVDRAKVHNVQTPYNRFVRNIVHAIENTYKEQYKPMIEYAADDVIIRQGEKSPNVLRIMHGSVSLFLNYGEENEYLIGVYNTGQFLGEYSCLSGSPNLFSVVANEDSVVMEIPEGELHNYISVNPVHAEEMLYTISKQTALMVKHIEMLQEEKQG